MKLDMGRLVGRNINATRIVQRRYDKMLTQRALFCHHANTKPGTLSQHFVTHVVPPLRAVGSFAKVRGQLGGEEANEVC